MNRKDCFLKRFAFYLGLLSFFVMAIYGCSNDDKHAGGSTEAGNSIAIIVDKTVAGVTQKGPMVKGSKVQVYELDEKSLVQLGNSFTGSVSGDDGAFTVSHINLNSPYVLLVANGAYYSELTGKLSSTAITLNALTDLSDRDNVNINLLTHLEYERALWLIHHDSLSISEAKAQASSEVLSAFISDTLDFVSENLDIFKAGKENGALLAISVLMQLGNSEMEFSKELADFVEDIQEDGTWDDDKAKANVADKAFEADLALIRSNVRSWEISIRVPKFETYVEYFWNDIFGLGRCTQDLQDTVRPNNNGRSKYNERLFICEEEHWILYEEEKNDSLANEADKPAKDEVDSSSILYPSVDLDTLESEDWLNCSKSMYCPKICMNIWDAEQGKRCSRVNTELDDGTDSFGYFWMHNDDASEFFWPAGDRGYGVEAASRDKYGYLYGRAILDEDENSYAAIAFHVSGKQELGNDLTDWKGLCVSYTSTEDFFMELRVSKIPYGTSVVAARAKMPQNNPVVVADIPWDRFVRQDIGTLMEPDEIIQNVSRIEFRFNEPKASSVTFKILAIGKLGSCNN